MIQGVNIFVSGRTQSGKSYLVKRAVAESPRLLVYLTKREDSGYPGIYFDAAAGVCEMQDNVGSWQTTGREAMYEWWRWCEIHGRRFRIVYRPKNPYDLAEFDAIAKLVYQCGDMTLVCEEVMTYLGSYDPRKTDPGQGVTTLLTAGATRGITTWLLTQRPVRIDHTVTSQARVAYLFATHEPAEVIYIRQAFGQDAADKLVGLELYQHVHWDDRGAQRIVEVCKA
jgi:hypothetical protein